MTLDVTDQELHQGLDRKEHIQTSKLTSAELFIKLSVFNSTQLSLLVLRGDGDDDEGDDADADG